MTAILYASALIQLTAMVALVGLAAAPILVSLIIRFSPACQRVIADRRQAHTEADEWFRLN